MVTRRAFAGALAWGLGAAELPGVKILTGSRIPDRLATESCVFTRAYTASPGPSLTRNSLLTGRYPHARPSAMQLAAAPDSTAVIFVSEPSDDTPFEPSTHIALAIQHPRLPRGKTFDFPLCTVDVAPTLLALAGIDVPDGLHGRDLSDLMISGKGQRPESIFAEGKLNSAGEWRMVVRGLDKLVVRPNLDVLHLFNLGDDPSEEHDLAQEIGYQLRVDELRALVRIWMKRTGDGMDPSGLKRR